MNNELEKLIEAEKKAAYLFEEVEKRNLIKAGKTEHQLSLEVTDLISELFGEKKFWHKKIVRAGKNTLLPYKEDPPNIVIENDDIVFIDFGPVFNGWEADFAKTYVLGNDEKKLKLMNDVESAWNEGNEFFKKNKTELTGAEFYKYTKELVKKYGWEYGNVYCGHLVGRFPHEKIIGEDIVNYIHPDNNQLMCEKDRNGNERFWIYEIHFIDRKLGIGGFVERML